MEVVHIASQPVQVGSHIRQRCVWCGAELVDQDLRYIAFQTPAPGEPEPTYPTWPPGGLVAKDEGMTYVVEHKDGDDLPKTSCVAPDEPPVVETPVLGQTAPSYMPADRDVRRCDECGYIHDVTRACPPRGWGT